MQQIQPSILNSRITSPPITGPTLTDVLRTEQTYVLWVKDFIRFHQDDQHQPNECAMSVWNQTAKTPPSGRGCHGNWPGAPGLVERGRSGRAKRFLQTVSTRAGRARCKPPLPRRPRHRLAGHGASRRYPPGDPSTGYEADSAL